MGRRFALRKSGVAVGPAGGIVIVGSVLPADFGSAFALARLTARGRIYATFNHDGRLVDHAMGPPGSNWEAGPVVVQPDGKIVVSGAFVGDHGNGPWMLQRYTSNGLHDASFGVDGLVDRLGAGDVRGQRRGGGPDHRVARRRHGY